MTPRWLRRRSSPATSGEREYRSVRLDYPVRPHERWGHGRRPPLAPVKAILDGRREVFRDHLTGFVERYRDRYRSFPMRATAPHEVAWDNETLPGFDVVTLYGMVRDVAPALYFEIGSGTSTKIARQAVTDGALSTTIVSLDPEPRFDIDAVCDETIRQPIEDVDLSMFDRLRAGDILFYDGSHRCLQNSDVTVMFLDVLPRLPSGVFVHIHDILLPDDYPDIWRERFYNEQYLLEAFLSHNPDWKILGALNYLAHHHHALLKQKCPYLTPHSEPASFWIQRIA